MKIAIIGAGNMGSAIARGISKGSIFKADDIHVSDPSAKSLEQIKAFNPNIKTFQANKDAIRGTDIVLLAVKPWLVGDVAKEIADDLTEEQILISIAAGVSIAQLQELFAKNLCSASYPTPLSMCYRALISSLRQTQRKNSNNW